MEAKVSYKLSPSLITAESLDGVVSIVNRSKADEFPENLPDAALVLWDQITELLPPGRALKIYKAPVVDITTFRQRWMVLDVLIFQAADSITMSAEFKDSYDSAVRSAEAWLRNPTAENARTALYSHNRFETAFERSTSMRQMPWTRAGAAVLAGDRPFADHQLELAHIRCQAIEAYPTYITPIRRAVLLHALEPILPDPVLVLDLHRGL